MLRRVINLSLLSMPINAIQYRVTVGIFDNQKLIINLRFELPACSKISSDLSNYDPTYFSLLFYIFLIAFLLSKGKVSKIIAQTFFIKNICLGLSLAKTGCKPFKRQPLRVVKHTQTICRLLLKICLNVYDLLVGLVIKGLRTSILTFFLTNSILMHCYYAFSTRTNVTFY